MYYDFLDDKPDYVYKEKSKVPVNKMCPYVLKQKVYVEIYWRKIFLFVALLIFAVGIGVMIIVTRVTRDSITFALTDYYFVSVGTYTELSSVESASASLVVRGGAGYVINDGEFSLIAGVYSSESDASIVASNISSEYENVAVEKHTINMFRLVLAGEDDKAGIVMLYKYPYEIFDIVHRLSESLDRGEITESYVIYNLQSLKTSIEEKIALCNSVAGYGGELALFFGDIYSGIDNLCSSYSRNLSGGLKYLMCDIVYKYEQIVK